MKILFDFINLQQGIVGSAVYTYKVLNALCTKRQGDMSIIGLYDSKKRPDNYNIFSFSNKKKIELVDVNSYSCVSDLIDDLNIDCFFIACGQYYKAYDLSGIRCRSIIVIHDLSDCELDDNRLSDYFFDKYLQRFKPYWIWLFNLLLIRRKYAFDYSSISNFIQLPSVTLVTVSLYTKYAFEYYMSKLKKNVYVLYPPLKETVEFDSIKNNVLKNIIQENRKFYLVVSANRPTKNARMVIETFKNSSLREDDTFLITVGYPNKLYDRHILLPVLSDSDLEYAYKYAYALIFPSITEGFGYPPLEAMKYGTPAICSNVCSMPEIYKDSVLWFSPFYKNALYQQIRTLEENYEIYKMKSKAQYEKIAIRQKQDLDKLIDLIIYG